MGADDAREPDAARYGDCLLRASSSDFTRLARSDRGDVVQLALAQLPAEEREVVVLRGIEQLPNREVAKMLGVDDSAVTRRFQRALQRLRELLPGSLFDEME